MHLNRSFLAFAIVFSLALTLAGCASRPVQVQQSCVGIDWWELGRTDGVAGMPATKINEYKNRCDSTAYPVNVELYNNGREAGLVDFCSPTQGFAAGRNGQRYENVCPQNLEKAFLEGYRSGSIQFQKDSKSL